jgi:predicted sugar kinase
LNCVQLGKNGLETLQLIHQAYGDDAMRQAVVFKWWKCFRDTETNVKDETQSDQEVKTTCSTILLKLTANVLQHIFKKWVERCKKLITCKGRYFKKDTVTVFPQSSDSE